MGRRHGEALANQSVLSHEQIPQLCMDSRRLAAFAFQHQQQHPLPNSASLDELGVIEHP